MLVRVVFVQMCTLKCQGINLGIPESTKTRHSCFVWGARTKGHPGLLCDMRQHVFLEKYVSMRLGSVLVHKDWTFCFCGVSLRVLLTCGMAA